MPLPRPHLSHAPADGSDGTPEVSGGLSEAAEGSGEWVGEVGMEDLAAHGLVAGLSGGLGGCGVA